MLRLGGWRSSVFALFRDGDPSTPSFLVIFLAGCLDTFAWHLKQRPESWWLLVVRQYFSHRQTRTKYTRTCPSLAIAALRSFFCATFGNGL
jgi:hypothetical protein